MKGHPLGSAPLLRTHRHLLWRVTRSDLGARYAGSVLGFGWVVLGPGAILAVYSIVYLQVFKLRVPGLSPGNYVLFIFSGLVPFLATGEALGLAAASIISNKSILSNTIFPIDLVPPGAALMAQGTMVVGFTVIIVAAAAMGSLSITVLLLPIIWGLFLMALTGIAWFLAVLNVLVRDLQMALTPILMTLLIASPIAFTPDQVPAAVRPLIAINPFAWFVTSFQRIMVLGEVPSALSWIGMIVFGVGMFVLGSVFFARAKGVIVDHV